MQKKRKPRRVKQKKHIRAKSPWHSQSKQDKKQNKQKRSKFSVQSANLAGLSSDIGNELGGLENIIRNTEYFEYEKPIVEVHSESEVSTLSTTKIMASANKDAGLIATKKDIEADARTLFGKVIFANFGLKVDDLDRVVIREDDADSWTIQYIFHEGTANQHVLPSMLKTNIVPYDPSYAELMIETVVALSMFEEGKVYPENSVQQRTFKFDEATVTVNKNLFRHIKEFSTRHDDLFSRGKPDTGMLQTFMFVCDGKITDDTVSEMEHDLRIVLDIAVSLALIDGLKQWPIETAS